MTNVFADVINIEIEQDDTGLFFATSKSIPGLFLAHRQVDAIMDDIPNVIRALYRRRYNADVFAVRAKAPDESRPRTIGGAWVTVPAHIAAAAAAA